MMESALQILSSCLHSSRDWLAAATRMNLTASDFAIQTHRDIWAAIERVLSSGQRVRYGQVETELRKTPDALLDAKNIFARGPSVQNPEVHIEIVISERMKSEAKTVLVDASASLDRVERISGFQEVARHTATQLDALALNSKSVVRSNEFVPVFERTKDEMQAQFDLQRSGGKPWITTGLSQFDQIIGGGWQRPGAYVIVGMSGKGKTHLGIHFALEASRSGAAVVYFTVEMPQAQIMRRIIANASKVPASAISSLNMTSEQFEKVEAVQATHSKIRLAIEDNFSADLDRLCTLVRKYRREGALDVAVVDYVQQLIPSKRLQTKQQEMLVVAATLKQICIQEGIVMIQLAQANREAEIAEQEGVRLSAQHIEHSHAIYQNADSVIFFQTNGEEVGSLRREMLWVAKNRHGDSCRAVPVKLDYEQSRLLPYG